MTRSLRTPLALLPLASAALFLVLPASDCRAQAPGQAIVETVFVRDPAIRSIPIEKRPNRPGHIYGNTYRRLYHGRAVVNQNRYSSRARR